MTIDYRLILGLLCFIGVLVYARWASRARMSDRQWMRTMHEPFRDSRDSIQRFRNEANLR